MRSRDGRTGKGGVYDGNEVFWWFWIPEALEAYVLLWTSSKAEEKIVAMQCKELPECSRGVP